MEVMILDGIRVSRETLGTAEVVIDGLGSLDLYNEAKMNSYSLSPAERTFQLVFQLWNTDQPIDSFVELEFLGVRNMRVSQGGPVQDFQLSDFIQFAFGQRCVDNERNVRVMMDHAEYFFDADALAARVRKSTDQVKT